MIKQTDIKRGARKKPAGGTLVEVLVYLGLFALVFVVFIRLFWYVTENNQRANYRIELTRSAVFVHEHLETAVASPNKIDKDSSVFDSDEGKLVLTDGLNTLEYILANGVLYVQSGGTAIAITSSRHTVEKFYLECIADNVGGCEGVRVETRFSPIKMPNMYFYFDTIYILK